MRLPTLSVKRAQGSYLQLIRPPNLFRWPPLLRRNSSSPTDEPTEDDRRRIYILGLGSKATLLTFFLSQKPDRPPISLLSTSRQRAQTFEAEGGKVKLFIDGQTFESGKVDIEVIKKQSEKQEDEDHSRGTTNTSSRRINIKEDAIQGDNESPRPIMNLICVVRSKWAASSINEVKERLRPDSAILAVQDGLGVLEEIFKLNYPDTRTRPSFRLGLMNHRMWVEDGDVEVNQSGTENKRLKPWGPGGEDWSQPHYLGKGEMLVGPLAINSLKTSRSEEVQGIRNTQYLVDQLLTCPGLSASKVDQRKLLRWRYRKLVKDTVVGPLTTLLEVNSDALPQHPEAQRIMPHLIREAWEVIRRDLPGTPIEELGKWIALELHDRSHSMAHYALHGVDTGIEKINGWLIGRAAQYGLKLPAHQLVMEAVIAKTEERRAFIVAQKRAERGTPSHSGPENHETPDEARPYEERPDKVEMKRERKRKRQQDMLGNQPMPETYTKPQITPVGSLRIRRV
ncbi:uncharacterized protein PAC_13054 [Phialocephala subalpina]|uniref:2-dehydropantoate 2-reductase n=1 Tax=Phialocephala subalpina TaxID=576137 RepID=A0A1L7XDW1_9HELO|nr:uncharacterized protein PAC_13054 [Phialocephala subalpina]